MRADIMAALGIAEEGQAFDGAATQSDRDRLGIAG
jgi:hypothetical protein